MSRDEVVKLERRAWADTDHGAGRAYSYDGISFWYTHGRGGPQPTELWRTPHAGWRHREDCHCERCAS